ncbi:hypothetical protein AQUCO_00900567v1 [Aquilegia coerulea]|uniref:Uncharacterized protein n=1 Tax=Aquilegia coerulea TaxID=218851 RepID=A0A2G5EE96_AQUCA|nr:hypothetical protein AQUCO_00900567v1 [Aquilegia coerulea]
MVKLACLNTDLNGSLGPEAITIKVHASSKKVCSMKLLATAFSASAPSTTPTHCARMWIMPRDIFTRNIFTGMYSITFATKRW